MDTEYQGLEEAMPLGRSSLMGGRMGSGSRLLGTASEVIDALGGTKALADILGVRASAVSNYRKQGFPAKAHYRLAQLARERGLNVAGIVFGGIIPETTHTPDTKTTSDTMTPFQFFASKGFQEITTPILQPAMPYINLLGEQMQNRLYRFTDPAGEQLCLRPDLTVPTALAYIDSGKTTRSLFCYEGLAFRYQMGGGSQNTKAREFIQSGIEILGETKDDFADDVLILRTILDALEQAGLRDYQIKVNDFSVFPNSITALKLEEKIEARLLRHYLRGRDIAAMLNDIENTNMQELTPKEIARILEGWQSTRGLSAYWRRLADAISAQQKHTPLDIALDITRGRKMTYYTSISFEVITLALGADKPIAAGGRYDALLRGLGAKKDIPACGGAISLDRLEAALTLQRRRT